MPYIKFLILIICALLLCYTTVRTLRISHAFNLQKALSEDASGCCFSLGFIGCSILCRNIRHIQDIQALLCSEYDRYEIIITMDTNLQPELFHDIVKQFKMIRVTPPDSSDLRHSPIRQLYRSRQRCFRRLILLDKGQTTSYDDFNAATTIASFDYLLPFNCSSTLRHHAIEDIAIILANLSNSRSPINLIRSTADNSLIFRRSAIVEAGGFSPKIIGKIPRKGVFDIHIPLRRQHSTRTDTISVATILTICTAILVALLFLDHTLALAIAATALAVGCSAHYLNELFDNKCSLRAIFYQISRMKLFFYPRKFFV